MQVRALFLVVLAAFIPHAIAGQYNANWSGTVTAVSAYGYNDQIIFSLSAMPSLPSGTCNTTAFAIQASDTDGESRNRMYATLLSAYLTGQAISVGYDNTGSGCADGFIEAYRLGL